ncbi:RNA 3'-terminal phosphate cyclase [Hydrogenivirga sp.]
MLEIDGSYGEGGGQIVRTALFLSTLLKVPVKVRNVRVKRDKPGLKRQHLHIVRLLKKLASAKTEGDTLGSLELTYVPGELKPGAYRVNFGSAGSISLFLQTVLPVSLFVPGRVEIEVVGGTEVPMSPTIDWVRFVYLPCISGVARSVRLEVLRRGYYPAGGGVVKLTAEGGPSGELGNLKSLRGFLKDRLSLFKVGQGEVKKLHLLSVAEERLRERRVVERQVEGAVEFLKDRDLPEPEVYRQYVGSSSIGTSVTLWLEDAEGNVMGSDNIGKKGKPAEVVGRECAHKLWEDWSSGATVDRHLADHLIPWIGLGGGKIRVPLFTGHLETNLWVCERFLGKGVFRISREEKVVEAVV